MFHLWAVSVGWNSGLLQGNEFRQSQTAITTLFVQREQELFPGLPDSGTGQALVGPNGVSVVPMDGVGGELSEWSAIAFRLPGR